MSDHPEAVRRSSGHAIDGGGTHSLPHFPQGAGTPGPTEHPAAGIFPLLSDSELAELAADIAANGLREPIVVTPDGILDGRNRYRACILAGVEPRFEDYQGSDPLAYVISMNLHRRHLNESQRAMVAARTATMGEGRPTKTAPIGAVSQVDVARTLNVSRRSVQRACQVIDHGTPELVQGVEAGHVPVSAAAQLVEAPPEYQQAVVAKVRSGEARSITHAKRLVRKETLPESVTEPDGKYRVVYADPPWRYGSDGLDHYGPAERHYPTMSTEAICQLPVGDKLTDNAVLFLWSTSPMLPDALRVMAAWGFQYKTSFVWDKIKHNFGHYNSVRHEFLLVGTRGSCTPDTSKLYDSVQVIERAGHSQKPEEFRQMIDSLYTWGPRIELFARRRAEGWDAWGNEA